VSLEKQIHILGLSTREQFLLKLLMSNLMAGYMEKAVSEAPWVTAEELALKTAGLLKFFQRYVEFSDMLCPESMLSRGRPKILMLGSTLMKYLVLAANGYDTQDNYLSPDHRQLLESQFIALKNKIVESSHHTYTSWEVEKARNTK
jgi:hypothetical protein